MFIVILQHVKKADGCRDGMIQPSPIDTIDVNDPLLFVWWNNNPIYIGILDTLPQN